MSAASTHRLCVPSDSLYAQMWRQSFASKTGIQYSPRNLARNPVPFIGITNALIGIYSSFSPCILSYSLRTLCPNSLSLTGLLDGTFCSGYDRNARLGGFIDAVLIDPYKRERGRGTDPLLLRGPTRSGEDCGSAASTPEDNGKPSEDIWYILWNL